MTMSYCTRFLLLVTTLLVVNPSVADIMKGRVVGIADGDTVTLLDSSKVQFKIRLMGIDAPEKKQAFGNKSKQSLSALVFNKQVSVEYSKQDRYGLIASQPHLGIGGSSRRRKIDMCVIRSPCCKLAEFYNYKN